LVTSSRVTSAIPLPPSVYPNGSVVQDPLIISWFFHPCT
jgi:hypothetical protein